jgi:hypothetical protein
MIFSAPPSLLRSIVARPEDSAKVHPYEMAAWWLAGRAGHAKPADSAGLEPAAQTERASRRPWSRLRTTRRAVAARCDRSWDDKGACFAQAGVGRPLPADTPPGL